MTERVESINFNAPAELRKLPSRSGQRASDSAWPDPYLVFGGTLEECIREFLAKPGQRHLYEVHTAPQGDIVSAVMSAAHVAELARLRDFL
jgi:hypothetical protein